MNTTPTPRPGRPRNIWKGRTVPYVTAWTGEQDISRRTLRMTAKGLGYLR
ncbi:hypothetical protein [Streptomyces sp. NPDC045470]